MQLRPAQSKDIRIGTIVYSRGSDGRKRKKKIIKVLLKTSMSNAFLGDDNCKYGLQGCFVKITPEDRTASICRIIKGQFPDDGSGFLYFKIVERAINDLILPKPKASKSRTKKKLDEWRYKVETWKYNKNSAISYLNGGIEHAVAAGLSARWIRKVIREGGIELTWI